MPASPVGHAYRGPRSAATPVWDIADPSMPYDSPDTITGVVVLNPSATVQDKTAVCDGLVRNIKKRPGNTTANVRVTWWLSKAPQPANVTCRQMVASYDYDRGQQVLAELSAKGANLPTSGYVALLIIVDGPDRLTLAFSIPTDAPRPTIANVVNGFKSEVVQDDRLKQIARNATAKTSSAQLGEDGATDTTGEAPSFFRTWVMPVAETIAVEVAKEGLKMAVVAIIAAV
jgi:hypothetical protein